MRAIVAFLTLAAFIAATHPLQANDKEAREIVTKAIKAHGGTEYLNKYKASQGRNKGKVTIPGIGEVEFEQSVATMAPDKFKEEVNLTVMGQPIAIVTIVNGDKFLLETNGKATEIPDAVKVGLKDAQYLLTIGRLAPLIEDKAFELSLVGEEKVDGKATIGVRVTHKGHKDVNLYFDKITHLLAKLEHRTNEPMTGNEITEERIVLEYKKNADGIPLPKHVALKHDGKPYVEVEVIEIEYLEKLDDSVFKK